LIDGFKKRCKDFDLLGNFKKSSLKLAAKNKNPEATTGITYLF